MPGSISAYFLPELVSPDDLRAMTVVVIDVLRASTTITTALAAGARQIIPCREIDDARRIAAEFGGDCLLGGERGGLPIDGFDLGNSPAEYNRERVAGKTIVFTTTNGTKAMQRCRLADTVVIGSFVNLAAVCRLLNGVAEVALLCAGTGGEITAEDVFLAGAVVDCVSAVDLPGPILNDQAVLARDAWRCESSTEAVALTRRLAQSRGGRNLSGIGLAGDITCAAEANKFDVVPRLDLDTWRIVLPRRDGPT